MQYPCEKQDGSKANNNNILGLGFPFEVEKQIQTMVSKYTCKWNGKKE